jgi:hypothetical protein
MDMTVQEIKQRIDREQGRSLPVHNERPRYLQAREASPGGQLAGLGAVGEAIGEIDARQLAQGLGWFSVALGVAEVAAPQWVASLVGVEDSRDSRALLSAFGVREIANGLAILAQPHNPLWVQTRIAGDVADLTVLGIAFGGAKNDQARVGAAIAAVVGVTALDVLCSLQLAGRRG